MIRNREVVYRMPESRELQIGCQRHSLNFIIFNIVIGIFQLIKCFTGFCCQVSLDTSSTVFTISYYYFQLCVGICICVYVHMSEDAHRHEKYQIL